MATRNGVSSILKGSRLICRMVGLYGVAPFAAATSSTPAFAAAVSALVGACQLFESLDDYPGQIDQTPPSGVEDEEPAEG